MKLNYMWTLAKLYNMNIEVSWKVLVKCFTYNQSDYILETLNGFAMQQTDFPFVCAIIDDASTDGEQEIIHQYINENFCITTHNFKTETDYAIITSARHSVNRNCYFLFFELKENHYSQDKDKNIYLQDLFNSCKYIALCEGDDYWIDSLKLQTQVDFLDKHSDYSLCYSDAKLYIQSKHDFGKDLLSWSVQEPKEILIENPVSTLTTMFRSDLYRKYLSELEPHKKDWQMGDYPMWLYFAIQSKIHYIPEFFAVYRYLDNSASHSTSIQKKISFIESVFEIKTFFNMRYRIMDQNIIDDLRNMKLFSVSFKYGDYDRAFYYYHNIRKKGFKQYVKFLLYKLGLMKLCHILSRYKKIAY